MTTSCNLRAPGMRTLMGRAMPLDPHCRGQRSDPLVLLVPHRDDDNAEIALRQPAGSDLSRRAGCRLHGVLQAVEFGALVIAHGRLYILDIEIVTGHRTLLLATPGSVLTFDRRTNGASKHPGHGRCLEAPGQGVSGEEALQSP